MSILVLLALVLFVLTCLRNTFVLVFPYLYGEDAPWISAIWRDGFLHAAFHARPDFPALLQMAVLQVSLLLNRLAFGTDIVQLPLAIWIVVNAFITLLVMSPMLIPRTVLSTGYRALICLLLTLMPIGFDSNAVYGRALNLQWFMPVLMQFVLSRILCDASLRRTSYTALLAAALLLMLSFPVCIFEFACFAAWRAFAARNNRRTMWTNLILDGILVLTALASVHPGLASQSAAFSNQIVRSGILETFIARPFLYPLIAPFYIHLGDTLAVLLTGVFVAVGAGLFFRHNADPSFRLVRNFLMVNAVVVSVIMLATRRGLTAFFGGYDLASVDHYFIASNMMVLVIAVFLVAGVRIRAPRLVATGAIVLLPLSWITILAIPERHLAIGADHGTLSDAICEVARGRTHVSQADVAAVGVPTYPFFANYDWTLRVPRTIFDATASKHCGSVLSAVSARAPAGQPGLDAGRDGTTIDRRQP